MENTERHTVYLTMTLFVRFLCNKKCGAADEKASAKKQSVLFRVLHWLSLENHDILLFNLVFQHALGIQ